MTWFDSISNIFNVNLYGKYLEKKRDCDSQFVNK